ncbi:hypothetical protein JW859_06765 [bacterium]|nr:hypothetical protein [bacterium]
MAGNNIVFNFVKGNIGTHGLVAYYSSEYYLKYERVYKVDLSALERVNFPELAKHTDPGFGDLVSTDWRCYIYFANLELCFAGAHRILISIEARANMKLWKSTSVDTPKITEIGALNISNPVEIYDHLSGGTIISEEYNEKSNTLRYQLSLNSAEQHYLIGTGIIIGIRDEKLTDIYLQNLIIK